MITRQLASSLAGIILSTMLCAAALANPSQAVPPAAPPARVRTFKFTYHADIPISNPSAKKFEAWIPLPRDDAFQQVRDLKIETPVHFEIVDQPTNGNRVAHLEASAPIPPLVPITMTFVVTRHEQAADMVAAARDIPEPSDGHFAAYLEPNRLVPLTGRIAQVSSNLSEVDATPLQQARVDYEYVTSIMKYDKSGTGWGRGDAVYACDVRHGNCTDFHSLFIGLARGWNSDAIYDRVPNRRGELGRGSRVSLLGGVLLWRSVGAGRRVRGVEASCTPRLLLRASRRGASRLHHRPRSRASAAAEWPAAQLSHLPVRRARRSGAAAEADQDEVFLRGRRRIAPL